MATDKKEKDPRTVTLLGVRLSFTDGIKEKKKTSDEPDAKPKHNFNIINEAGTQHFDQNHKRIMAAIRAAGEQKWKNPDAFKAIQEDNPKRLTYRKGDKFKSKSTGEVYAGYAGNYAFGVSGPSGGQKRPILKDKYKRDVEEKDILDVFYGGTYGDVIVSFYGTDKGSRGIFATCELIRSHQKGERMAGGYAYDEDDLDEMDDIEDDGDDGLEDMSGGGKSSSDDLDDDDLLG